MLPFRKGHFMSLTVLIKCKAGADPENKGVQHGEKHSETEPAEQLQAVLDQKMAEVPEGTEVNFLDE